MLRLDKLSLAAGLVQACGPATLPGAALRAAAALQAAALRAGGTGPDGLDRRPKGWREALPLLDAVSAAPGGPPDAGLSEEDRKRLCLLALHSLSRRLYPGDGGLHLTAEAWALLSWLNRGYGFRGDLEELGAACGARHPASVLCALMELDITGCADVDGVPGAVLRARANRRAYRWS